jgi:hypothetical protein
MEEKIYRFIAEYKIEKAFESIFSLVKLLNNNDKHEKSREGLILLSARYSNLIHEKLIGILSNDDANLESNKIIHGILQITKQLINSSEYKSLIFSQGNDDKEYKLVHDTSRFSQIADFKDWGTFSSKGQLYKIALQEDSKNSYSWTLTTSDEEQIGANIFLDFLKGKVVYKYFPIEFNEVKDNLLFFMIPMKSNKSLIEVGTTISDDPNNGYSPFRIRKLAKTALNQWHEDEIEFDFTNTPEAKDSVFAFRINEGTPRASKGKMLVKDIKIYKKISQ